MSMANRPLNLLALFTAVNTVGLLLLTLQAAEAAPEKHSYNPALVAIYTSSCMKQVKTPKAKQACQCSVKEMQKYHPQTQAVAIVKQAKSSSSIDPSTGVPTEMSKYFAPCL
jgi:hypothetical protein